MFFYRSATHTYEYKYKHIHIIKIYSALRDEELGKQLQVLKHSIVNILPLLVSFMMQSCVCQHTVFALKSFATPPASYRRNQTQSICYLQMSLIAAAITFQILHAF